MKPDFSSQTIVSSQREFHEFALRERDKFQEKGATWYRATEHPDRKGLVLVEAWKHQPAFEPDPEFLPFEESV